MQQDKNKAYTRIYDKTVNSTQMEGTLLSAATCINNNIHIWHSETCRNSGHLCKCLETKPSTI